MTLRVSFLPFVALAGAVHAAAFAVSEASGRDAAGAAGVAGITVVGADATLGALVAEWERPPATAPVSAPAQAATPTLPDMTSPSVQAAAESVAPPASSARAVAPPAVAQRPAPAPRARPAGLASPQRAAPADVRAAGAGGGGAAGVGAAAVSSGEAQRAARAVQAWAAAVQAALQRRLPATAGGSRSGTTVVVALSVALDGGLRSAAVAESSGDPALDAAALAAVRRLGRLPAAPERLPAAVYAFEAPLVYRAR